MDERQYHELRRQQLEILMNHGESFSPSLKTEFENSGLYIGNGSYCIMLLNLPSAFSWDEPSFHAKWNTLYDELRDTVSAVLQSRYLNHTEVINCSVCSLICLTDSPTGAALSNAKLSISSLAEKICDFFESTAGEYVRVCISDVYEGISGIKSAWEDARDMREFLSFLSLPPQILAQKNQEASAWHTEESVVMRRWLDKIMDGIRDNDENQIYKYSEEYIHFITTTPPFGKYYLNLRVQLFFNHLMSALLESRMAHNDFVESINPIIGLTMADTEQSFRNLFYDYLYNAWNNYREVTHDSSAVQITEIKEYIDSHISDINLDVAFLTERFKMSSSSLTYQFKKHWSYTPTEYISRRRTADARRLIASTELPIEEIALKSGFGSYLTMHRAFKKFYGTAPGAFRSGRGGKASES